MKALTRALKVLGYIWASPTSIGALIIWFLPLWLFRQLRPTRWSDGAWEWGVVPGSWFEAKYSGTWAATTLGFIIFLSPGYESDQNTHVHERRHVQQCWVLGGFFLPMYGICYLIGYANTTPPPDSMVTNGYWWNRLEEDARAFAQANPTHTLF